MAVIFLRDLPCVEIFNSRVTIKIQQFNMANQHLISNQAYVMYMYNLTSTFNVQCSFLNAIKIKIIIIFLMEMCERFYIERRKHH